MILDESVWAKIISTNVYGDSVISDPGNNAVIQLVPDAPINLFNDPATTSDLVIKFTWDEGAHNGGVDVIDFDIYYNQGSAIDSFVLLESGVLTEYYETTVALISGEIYTFKVTSRNTVGSSLESEPISLMAAKLPDAPVSFTNLPLVTNA